jgi:hypothetical protein
VTRQSRRLLQLGLLLLLLGLLIGLTIPALSVPRLGVAAHLNAVVGGRACAPEGPVVREHKVSAER